MDHGAQRSTGRPFDDQTSESRSSSRPELSGQPKVRAQAGVSPFLLAFHEPWIPQLMMASAAGRVLNSENPDFVNAMTSDTGSYADLDQAFAIIDMIMARAVTDSSIGKFSDDASLRNYYLSQPWQEN